MGRGRRLRGLAAIMWLGAFLAACATAPGAVNDPLEPVNRAVFAFNTHFNDTVTLPVAWVYEYQLPQGFKRPFHNVLANIESPVTFTNDVLQGHVQLAAETLSRFLLNSTLGLGGLSDFAADKAHIRPHQADFGQTLAAYGIGPGPFLVLPVIGPSSPRDILGGVADLASDPLFYVPADWPLLAHAGTAVGLHTFAPYEANYHFLYLRTQMLKESVDPYVTMRSVYRQHRAEEAGGIGTPVLPEWNN